MDELKQQSQDGVTCTQTPPPESAPAEISKPSETQEAFNHQTQSHVVEPKDRTGPHADQDEESSTKENDTEEPITDFPWSQPLSSTELTSAVAYEWLQDMSSRITKLESSPHKEEVVEEAEEYSTPSPDSEQVTETTRTEPKVRDCDWEHFKNRYSVEDCTYAVEALLSGNDLDGEMEEEQLTRLSDDERENFIESRRRKPSRRAEAAKELGKQRIERVRINSPAVLALLKKVTGETSWSDKPHTFLRPFKILVHFHDKMEEEFSKLKAKFGTSDLNEGSDQQEVLVKSSDDSKVKTEPESVDGDKGTSKTTDSGQRPIDAVSAETASTPESKDNSSSSKTDGVLNSLDYKAYEEVKTYMDFIQTRLLPEYHKFDNLDHSHRPKVQYADLWSLFRLGELAFERDDSKANSSRKGVSAHRPAAGKPGGRHIWRIYSMTSETIDWTVNNLEDAGGDLRRHTMNEPGVINISAYYIDFDGTSYKGVPFSWTIAWFDGEKDITKLDIYPVRFENDYQDTLQHLQERGQRFQNLLQTHVAVQHDGWTLTHAPGGNPIDEVAVDKAEYIDSDVIIDFQEAYQVHATWKPAFGNYILNQFEPAIEDDNFTIIQWSGPDRSQTIRRTKEVVIQSDEVSSLEWNQLAATDDFLIGEEVRTTETDPTKQKFTLDDLALLPARLFVYSLRQRRFVNADIANLKQLPVVYDPFNDLKISEMDKVLIRSVVHDHFDKKEIQRNLQIKGTEPVEQDFIRGKGKGLVILLHGAPGVGKTATAEAVAAAHRRPLFPITCGDLGIDPMTVESTLSEIFRLANLWDCVLLLDEAEIFLSHREKKDDNLQRNALVSIFLRTLEYYPGILFLTTNRVGVLDEALNSRVHVSLHFKHLDSFQTLELFKMNLKRSEMIARQRAANTSQPELIIRSEEIQQFALENFDKRPNPSGPWWNGRQIRNAFQIATSLAYVGKDRSGCHLGREHFEQVLRFIQGYDQYRQNLFHKTDSELAEHREERYSRPVGETMGRRDDRGGERYMPPSFARHSASYSASSTSNRGTPDRQLEPEFPGLDPRGSITPTRGYRREPSLSPNYLGFEGPSQRPPSRREYGDREYDDYGYPRRGGGM
ncbi:hypothetical protein FSARC_10680 [Fusarium sarcochroum]|uniref:AAA+ ATPase domain-containing protein n=1 Tax=Fusarium sarcochroum TaxID=1208366 RepID=A0A8H4TKU6_9HYPO|nr:hypothetical protein FSARC_10680 [Fusarium sarcochroum]